jgi:hypothetical protein
MYVQRSYGKFVLSSVRLIAAVSNRGFRDSRIQNSRFAKMKISRAGTHLHTIVQTVSNVCRIDFFCNMRTSKKRRKKQSRVIPAGGSNVTSLATKLEESLRAIDMLANWLLTSSAICGLRRSAGRSNPVSFPQGNQT